VQVLGAEARLGRGGLVVFVDGEGLEVAIEVLHVRDVAAEADDCEVVEAAETLDVGEAGEGTVGCWKHALVRAKTAGREVEAVPRLSAAITTPSLYLMPRTDVPVTTGLCVCVIGPLADCAPKCE